MQALLRIAAVAFAVLLQGCVPYPIYKTLQPAAEAQVLSTDGTPIEAAEVVLIARAWPYGREQFRNSASTDRQGKAGFAAIREWRVETLMIHGAQAYFWNWCVKKAGFETLTTTLSSSERFPRHLVVRLMPGTSSPCPAVQN